MFKTSQASDVGSIPTAPTKLILFLFKAFRVHTFSVYQACIKPARPIARKKSA